MLTNPGYYLVLAGPEAAVPTQVYIQVVDSSAGETSGKSATPAEPKPASAIPTKSRVLVNGKEVAFGAYNIDGYNYFKLRDLAMALSGTVKFLHGVRRACEACTYEQAGSNPGLRPLAGRCQAKRGHARERDVLRGMAPLPVWWVPYPGRPR